MPRTKFATAAAESSAGRSHPCRRSIDPRSPRTTTTTTARCTPAHSLVGGIRRSPTPPRCPNSRSPIAVRDSSSSPGRRVRLGEAARNDDDERSPSPDDDRRALRASSCRSRRSSSSLGGGGIARRPPAFLFPAAPPLGSDGTIAEGKRHHLDHLVRGASNYTWDAPKKSREATLVRHSLWQRRGGPHSGSDTLSPGTDLLRGYCVIRRIRSPESRQKDRR